MSELKHGATLIMDTLSPVYIKLAKRLNQLSCMIPRGFAIMTVTIVLVDGEPILWLKPEIEGLAQAEPKGSADVLLDRLRNMRK